MANSGPSDEGWSTRHLLYAARCEVIAAQVDDWVDPELVLRSLFGSSVDAYWLDGGDQAANGHSYLEEVSPRGIIAEGHPTAGIVRLRRPSSGDTDNFVRTVIDLRGQVRIPSMTRQRLSVVSNLQLHRFNLVLEK